MDVNTVVDLIGEDVLRVAALMDRCGTPVEINSTVPVRIPGKPCGPGNTPLRIQRFAAVTIVEAIMATMMAPPRA